MCCIPKISLSLNLFNFLKLVNKRKSYTIYFREDLFCIISEAFQHICNATILTVSNTTLLILSVLFGSEQKIPLVVLSHMFLMKVAVVRITITERALYKLLHTKIKSGVVSKPHFGIKLFSEKSTSPKCWRLRYFFMAYSYVAN